MLHANTSYWYIFTGVFALQNLGMHYHEKEKMLTGFIHIYLFSLTFKLSGIRNAESR